MNIFYKCGYCQSSCYIPWFEWLFKFVRPTVYKWRKLIAGDYLCPQHTNLLKRTVCKYTQPSDYETFI